MNLNELRDEAYSIAKANGWHEQEHSNEHWLMLIITEIAEAVQADRKGYHANIDKFIKDMSDKDNANDTWFRLSFGQNIKNSVEDELCDVVIRCLDLAGLRRFDLEEVEALMEMAESIKEGKGFIDLCYALSLISTCDDSTEEKVIRIIAVVLKYCELTAIDIDFFIRTKMNYNRLRGYKHGGKKY